MKELEDKNPQYFITYINIKDIANFPLGTIIDNQRKLNIFAGKKIDLFLNLENIESKMLFEIPELKKVLVKP